MKLKNLVLFSALVSMVPMIAFAAEVPAEIAPPEWLVAVLMFLQSIPAVGAVIVKIAMIAGLVSSVMTGVSIGVQGVLKGLSVIAAFSGLAGVAEKIQAFSDKVLPWLKYVSMFNVQKK